MVAQSEFNLTIEMLGGPAMIVEVKPGPRFSWWKINKAAEEYLGFTIEDVPGGPDIENVEGLSPVRIKQRKEALFRFRRCFATKGPVTWDFTHLRPDGSEFWSRHTAVPIFGDGGEIQQLLLSSIDITELVETQKEMQTVIESFGAPMVIIDVGPDERFTFRFFNSSAEQFFDLKNDEMAGRDVDDFEGVDEYGIVIRKSIITLGKRCVATKMPLSVEQTFQRPGRHRWARLMIVPVFNAAGEVKQIMTTVLDITELVETQKRLEEALTQTLSGFVTICAYCKNIKDDEQQWQSIEKYAAKHMNIHQVSHGMCPTCYEREIQQLDT